MQTLLCLLLILSVSWVTFSTDCPGGVFLSPLGNDTTGNGTPQRPFQSFLSALKYLYKQQPHALICLLPGTYHYYSYQTLDFPFDSITVTPADLSQPLPILDVIYMFNTSRFQISNFNVISLSLYVVAHCNVSFHDLYNATNSSSIDITYSGVITYDALFERIRNMAIFASSESMMKGSVSIKDSMVYDVSIGEIVKFSLSNCILQSFVETRSQNVSITNCTASHLNLTKRHFIFIIDDDYYDIHHHLVLKSNNFINNTLHTDTWNTFLWVDYLSSFYCEDNYFSCNLGVSKDNVPFSLILFPEHIYEFQETIVNNTVDQQCPPTTCEPGKAPAYQDLTCAPCSVSFTSPDGKKCVPCPPGTENLFHINCTRCYPGEFNPFYNSTCHQCEDGTPNQNATGCLPCPKFFYTSNGFCMPCGEIHERSECPVCNFFQEPPTCTTISKNAIIMVGGVSGGVVLIILLAIGIYRWRKRTQYIQLQ